MEKKYAILIGILLVVCGVVIVVCNLIHMKIEGKWKCVNEGSICNIDFGGDSWDIVEFIEGNIILTSTDYDRTTESDLKYEYLDKQRVKFTSYYTLNLEWEMFEYEVSGDILKIYNSDRTLEFRRIR